MFRPTRSKQQALLENVKTPAPPPRVGNVAVMLDLMQPLQIPPVDGQDGRRRLLADLCRLVGVSVGATAPTSPVAPVIPVAASAPHIKGLSPRQSQTLLLLLQGQSEKQVARVLGVSVHTVHVYVKALYRRFDVSSRAELLALHVNAPPPDDGRSRAD